MGDHLSLVESKVEAVLELVERINREKSDLQGENNQLKADLALLKKQFSVLKADKADRNETVRSKLQLVLSRVEELEALAG